MYKRGTFGASCPSLVLPAAIDKEIIIAISLNGTSDCNFYAIDVDESFSFPIDEMRPSLQVWPDYLMGVLDEFQKRQIPIHGLLLVTNSKTQLCRIKFH